MLINGYEPHINNDALLVLSLILCIIVTIRSIYLRKKVTSKDSTLKTTTTSLASSKKELNKLKRIHNGSNDFKSNLNNAELTTELQKSRLAFSHINADCQPPERYQYIHSLTEKGISSFDIASILSISVQEAEQLVTLANLAKKQTSTQKHPEI